MTKNVLGFNAGAAIPFSDFAKKDFRYYSGFAVPGFDFEIRYSRTRKYLGLFTEVGYTRMGFNNAKYVDTYNQVLGQSSGVHAETAAYQICRIMAGFTIKTPVFYNINLLFYCGAGYAVLTHPSIYVTDEELGNLRNFEEKRSGAPISCIGVKVEYHLSDKYLIDVGYGQCRTTPAFKDSNMDGHFDLPVRYQNVSLGLSYLF